MPDFVTLSTSPTGTILSRLTPLLASKSLRMGTAESCTGGLAASLCTGISGSSAWFTGGIVAYANEVKTALLGVSPQILARHGAVSRETAEAMTTGCLAALNVDCALAITGIAGPDGGTAEKPVGTVWIAAALHPKITGAQGACSPEQPLVRATLLSLAGTRNEIQEKAARAALALLACFLSAEIGKI